MVSKELRSNQDKSARRTIYALIFAIGVVLAVLVVIILRSAGDDGHSLADDPKPVRRETTPSVESKTQAPTVEPSVAPEESEPIPREVAGPPPIEIPVFTGSRMQKRLQFGDFLVKLRALRDAKGASDIQIGNAIADCLSAQMALDNVVEFERQFLRDKQGQLVSLHSVNGLPLLFDWLAGLARSEVNLMLSIDAELAAKKQPKSPRLLEWGDEALVRVWTKSRTLERFNVNEAERMLQQLHGIAKVEIGKEPLGFDALVGEGLGIEFFPHNSLRDTQAQGVYVIQDKVALVKSQPNLQDTEAVLKHELVHAFTYGLSDKFESSRFVSEGLAEYLRFLQMHDEARGPADSNFAGEAHLLLSMIRMMRAQGASLEDLDFKKLVTLAPIQFYQLGPFGYLTAQCSLAYIDWQQIARSLEAKNDEAIVAAIGGISWAGFEAFLEGIASRERERVFTVQDRVSGPPEGRASSFKRIMRDLGAKIPRDSLDPNVFNVVSSVSSGARSARGFLSDAVNSNLLILSDVSDQLSNGFLLADLSGVPTFPVASADLNVATGKSFVESLYVALDRQVGLRREGALGELHEDLVRATSMPLSIPPIYTRPGSMSFIGLSSRLRQWQIETEQQEPPLIIVVASQDSAARAAIINSYGAELEQMAEEADREEFIRQTLRLYYQGIAERDNFHAGAILVIDLAKGLGDAAPIADALMQVYVNKGLSHSVTLWDPQQAPSGN